MSSIQELYDEIKEVAEEIDSSVFLKASEGTRGVTIGTQTEHPQYIEVEFDGSVDTQYRQEFLQIGNRTNWEFIDSDEVFDGNNGGLVTFERHLEPENAPQPFNEFERSEDLS